MDGRGRQSVNSGPASTAPLMSPYYAGSQPLTPSGDSGSGFSPRDRFWTNNNGGGRGASPDPWVTSGYIPQLLPPPSSQDGMTPNYSPASHHSLNNNNSPPGGSTFNLNIPSHSPYPPGNNGNQPPLNTGTLSTINGSSSGSSDMSSSSPFSGPSPPNQAIPLSSPYGPPPNSNSPRSRQYTPSTTPSPHVNPHVTPPNLNGINGNSHSNSNDSPPNSGNGSFEGYATMNGNLDNASKNNGPSDGSSTGHPNELPGYLPPPQQSHNSSRYPGENKASSDGEMIHPYHQQHGSYYHQNYGHYPPPQQNQVYYDSYHTHGQGRRPFDPYHPYQSNPTNHQSNLYTDNSYESQQPTSQVGQYNSTNSTSSSNNASTPSNRTTSGGNSARVSKHPPGENGTTKIDSCESLQGGLKEGYEDEANFEAVLHGHMNNYGLDHPPSFNSYGHGSYDTERTSHSEEPNILEKRPSSQSQDSSKSDDSNSGSRPPPPLKREKAKKKRNPKGRPSNDTKSIVCKNEEDDPTKASFLGIGHPQSPKPLSRLSIENESGPPKLMDERSNSSSNQFSDSGQTTIDRSPTTLPTTHTPPNSQSTTISSAKKKKPWKKAKQINSEQLLKERERHCAEYVESTERSLEMCREGKAVKGKEESSFFPHHHHHYEERNITIDHQKESEVVKKEVDEKKDCQSENSSHATTDDDEVKKEKKDVPMVECGCFPVDEVHPEPGPFYTHLGAAHTLPELRETLEVRTGFRGPQLRFEKVIYTGKEGKTSQGCPLAKWIIRRGSYEEQLLFLVKHRKGHKCATAWIVVCCVIWEGVPPHFADNVYDTLVYKLNRFGIPTTRRSDTNEQRSCACQGVDPDTCGAAYSFGCAWSMFFNGCKYARSRNVRKFRLTEEHEEAELEEKVSHLATHLGPLYERVAPDSYKNQIEHENEGLECRLGYRSGRPFSGVTACVDYCSHAHKDAHNMINGCTVTVAFTRNRSIAKGDDEQFHVLPLYKLDDSDELGSREGQKQKIKKGQLEILKKFPSKVRVRKVPLLPSRRRGKVKPPSGNSSSHSHHHHQSKASDLYSPDHGHGALAMPPPMKREKLSIFEELNGPSGGSDLFDTRFHHPGPPPPFNPDGPGSSLWNHPYGQSSHHHGQPPGPHFRSYFDSAPLVPPPSSLSTPTSQYSSTPTQFGHNLELNLSSPRGGSNSSISNSNSNNLHSPSHGSTNSNNTNNSSSRGNNDGTGTASMTTTPAYTSMSPSILPSFRHTFMTEAESLSMLSAMASPATGPGGSPIADSTSSPRTGKNTSTAGSSSSNAPNTSTSPVSATPSAAFNHQDALGFSNPSSVYFNTSSSSSGTTPSYSTPNTSSLYHPHPHHATPSSCLSSPPSQSGGSGMSFNSSNYSSGSSFGPPPTMDPHHHPAAAFGGMSAMSSMTPWNASMNMNSTGAYSAYGPSQAPPPPYHSHQHQMTSLNMNPMSSSHFQMNQYSPYGNQPNFMTPSSMAAAAVVGMHHPHHHAANPWANPLPGFGSHMTGHHHAPPPPPSCFVAPPKPKVIPEVNETFSDNEDAFKDSHLGGIAIALTHGSVILQCAKHEMHATTSLKSPNRLYPSRICLVFYQHKSMNNRFHGWSEWEKKIEAKKLQEVKLINQGKLEASPRKMKQLIKEGYIADNP